LKKGVDRLNFMDYAGIMGEGKVALS